MCLCIYELIEACYIYSTYVYRYDNGAANYYDGNAHQSNWIQPHKTKPIKSPEMKDVKEQTIPGTVASKKKRKPMSKSYPSSKWDEKDAEKALQAEKDFTKNLKNQSLIIRFPDPELSKDIVKQFHSAIENVHFPQASTPRYCFAHLEVRKCLTLGVLLCIYICDILYLNCRKMQI